MKTKTFLFFAFLLSFTFSIGQCPEPPSTEIMTGNAVEALISNGGDLFYDGTYHGSFQVPVEILPHRSTILVAGLWMGGYDEGQNLKVAAQTYGRNYDDFDYIPGPLNPESGEPYTDNCVNFNKVWKVEKQDILDHIADFEDNGVIDYPIASIYSWPGHNTVHCYYYNGFLLPYSAQKWAPFYDKNNNGNYDPEEGDYPHPQNVIPNLIPEQISWTVFNDNTIHEQTGGVPLNVEVQLTSWNFTCVGNHVLKHSLFTSHKIINRSQEDIDSMYVGLWVDFDNGCHLDDYIGCSPENNGFLVYNADALDGESSPVDCGGVPTYAYNPPAQSVAFLNQSLDKFMYYRGSGGVLPPPNSYYFPPESPSEFYSYLGAKWTNGMPLTYGGAGYDLSGNGIPTDYAYPDNPNDESGWSLYTEEAPDGERLALGSTFVGKLEPGELFKLDMAHTYHGYSTLDYLGSANQAYVELAQVKQMYDMKFNGWCNDIVAETKNIHDNLFEVFPNPGNGLFYFKSETQKINYVEVYDQLGKLAYAKILNPQVSGTLDLTKLNQGVYILKIKGKYYSFVKKIIIQ